MDKDIVHWVLEDPIGNIFLRRLLLSGIVIEMTFRRGRVHPKMELIKQMEVSFTEAVYSAQNRSDVFYHANSLKSLFCAWPEISLILPLTSHQTGFPSVFEWHMVYKHEYSQKGIQ